MRVQVSGKHVDVGDALRARISDELTSAIGNAHFVSEKNIDGFVKAIREKIEPDLKKPAFIHTIGDIGYKFETV